MLFLVRILLVAILIALPVAAHAAGAGEPEGLTAREAGALRKAIYGLNTSLLRGGREELIYREAVLGTPSLSEEERARIETRLYNHVPTIRGVQEILNLRQRWRKRSVDLFVFWWHPVYRDDRGNPARSPTTLEAMKLEAVSRAAGQTLGVEPPSWLPYRIDPTAERARAFPRTDLRWGVWATDSSAWAAVVEAVALERGGVPGIREPLGALLGRCHEDEACREELLAEAERSAGEAGLVPVLGLLTAGTLGDVEDPAYATSLLFVNLLLQEASPEEWAGLLDGLRPDLDPEEVRRVLRATMGSAPERYDRRLSRQLREGRRDRLGR